MALSRDFLRLGASVDIRQLIWDNIIDVWRGLAAPAEDIEAVFDAGTETDEFIGELL